MHQVYAQLARQLPSCWGEVRVGDDDRMLRVDVPRSGVDFLYRLVPHRPAVELALDRDRSPFP